MKAPAMFSEVWVRLSVQLGDTYFAASDDVDTD
jgi:hypothetical protein